MSALSKSEKTLIPRTNEFNIWKYRVFYNTRYQSRFLFFIKLFFQYFFIQINHLYILSTIWVIHILQSFISVFDNKSSIIEVIFPLSLNSDNILFLFMFVLIV